MNKETSTRVSRAMLVVVTVCLFLIAVQPISEKTGLAVIGFAACMVTGFLVMIEKTTKTE